MKTFKKKLIAVLVSVVVLLTGAAAFTGCHFRVPNEMRNLRQVVAVVLPNTQFGYDDRGRPVYGENIYKWQLIQAVNQAFQGQNALPTEQAVNDVLDNLVNQRLIAHEATRMFESGDVFFRDGALGYRLIDGERVYINAMEGFEGDCVYYGTGLYTYIDGERVYLYNVDFTDINNLRRALFNSIDQELASIRRDILNQHGHDQPAENQPGSLPQPEFPVREVEPQTHHVPEHELFMPERANWPGVSGDSERRSLEIEALRRFTSNIIQVVEGGVREYDSAKLEADRNTINEFLRTRNYTELYLWLVDSYLVYQIGARDMRQQIEDGIINRFLTEAVEVSDTDVENLFMAQRETQQFQFSRDQQAFASAVSGNQNILFRPNNNFFYVKHVLLPFSDAQTAQLANFRQRPNVTRAEIEEFRNEQLVNDIRVHRRDVNGFPILEREYTAQEVLSEVVREVNRLSANLTYATRRFTDFIYEFNTDPGAFTHPLGYAMPHDREAGGQFMPEFEQGGWELAENHFPGVVLNRFVVTDFGVHIMMYASNPPANYTALLGNFQTPANENTWFDVFYNQLREARERDEFEAWARRTITSVRNQRDENGNQVSVQTVYNRRFRDLILA